MATLHSTQHKEIVGSVNGAPYTVSFDAEGFAEVEDLAVVEQLTSGSYGVDEIDEDGAIVTPEMRARKAEEAKRLQAEAEEAERQKAEAERLKAEAEAKKSSKKEKSEKGDA